MNNDLLKRHPLHEALLKSYPQYLKANRHCRSGYYAVHRFLRWLEIIGLSLHQVRPEHIQRFLLEQKTQGSLKPSTWTHLLYYLRPFFRYAQSQGAVKDNPAEEISYSWLDVEGHPAGVGKVIGGLTGFPKILRRYFDSFLFAHLENYLQCLKEQGFSRKTLQAILSQNFRFYHFLKHIKISRLEDVAYDHFQTFLDRYRRAFKRQEGRKISNRHFEGIKKHVGGFLMHALKKAGLVFEPAPVKPPEGMISPKLLKEYLEFGRSARGLCESTLRRHEETLRRLEHYLLQNQIVSIAEMTLGHLDAFLLDMAPKTSRRRLGHYLGVLRSFLRYLFLKGAIEANWADCLIAPKSYAARLRPKYIPWTDVQKLLGGIDQTTDNGKRDYAIFLLLATYGLRAREVAGLRLDDIDWQEKRLVITRAKSGVDETFALTQETERALMAYLNSGRPPSPEARVFLTHQAPIRPLSSSTFHTIVERHLRRLDIKAPCYGPYLLRHSFAKALLDRGADIFTVKHLLGHRKLSSTMIYTQIATEDLREVADNYAELL